MSTDDLIARLGADAGPAPRRLAARRVLAGLTVGVVASAIVMQLWLGVREGIADTAADPAFWLKFAYTAGIAVALAGLAVRLGRPGARLLNLGLAGLAPPAILLILALSEFAASPAASRTALVMGSSSDVCPWRIVALSAPVLIGLLWALRGLAPTRPALSGVAAGLCAGGAGAFVYAFHCGEYALPFLAVWYSLGVLICGVLGGLIGWRLLRW